MKEQINNYIINKNNSNNKQLKMEMYVLWQVIMHHSFISIQISTQWTTAQYFRIIPQEQSFYEVISEFSNMKIEFMRAKREIAEQKSFCKCIKFVIVLL